MGGDSSSLKKVKQDYFIRVNNINTKSTFDNNNNPENYCICFEKKDFETLNVYTQINIHLDQKYIPWKKYLLYYLRRQAENNIEWARQLHYIVTEKDSFNESLWHNNFFFQEYKILTEPKCLLKYERSNQNKDKSKFNTSVYNFRNNFMGSFLTTTDISISTTDTTKKQKEKTKQYVKVFQQHIFNEKHPINVIVREFVKLFNASIKTTIQDIKTEELTQEEKEKRLNTVIEQLQKFIIEMQVVLKLFYSNTISLKYFIKEKDEFINLMTSLVFGTHRLYEELYSLYAIVFRDEIRKMRSQLKKYKFVQTEDLDIGPQFKLNSSTRTFQESLLKTELSRKDHNKNANGNKADDDDDGDELILKPKESIDIQTKVNRFKEIQANPKNTIHDQAKSLKTNVFSNDSIEFISSEIQFVSESQKINVFKKSKRNLSNDNNDNEAFPFFEAIKLLKSLASCKIPFEKLMIIATISAEITQAINEYWKDMETAIKDLSLLSISIDQLMTLYIYIIIKAEIPEMIIHSMMVTSFTTAMTKSTTLGYYFSTLVGALDYLLNNEPEELLNKNKKNS